MATEIIKEIIKETAENISEKVDEFKENIWGEEQQLIISEFKENPVDKVKSTLENLNNSTELFEKSGFKLEGMEISLGLPPEIIVEFTATKNISAEEKKQMLTEAGENRIVKIILTCLFKAEDYYEKIKFGSYKIKSINITLGLIPGILMKFGRE